MTELRDVDQQITEVLQRIEGLRRISTADLKSDVLQQAEDVLKQVQTVLARLRRGQQDG